MSQKCQQRSERLKLGGERSIWCPNQRTRQSDKVSSYWNDRSLRTARLLSAQRRLRQCRVPTSGDEDLHSTGGAANEPQPRVLAAPIPRYATITRTHDWCRERRRPYAAQRRPRIKRVTARQRHKPIEEHHHVRARMRTPTPGWQCSS